MPSSKSLMCVETSVSGLVRIRASTRGHHVGLIEVVQWVRPRAAETPAEFGWLVKRLLSLGCHFRAKANHTVPVNAGDGLEVLCLLARHLREGPEQPSSKEFLDLLMDYLGI